MFDSDIKDLIDNLDDKKTSSQIYDYINQLDELVRNGKSAFMNKDVVQINTRDVLTILNKMRSAIPSEIIASREILRQVLAIKQKAKDYEDETVRCCEKQIIDVQAQAQKLVQESVIVDEAKRVASGIMKKANDYNKSLLDLTNQEIDKKLKKAEDAMAEILVKLRSEREELKGAMLTNK